MGSLANFIYKVISVDFFWYSSKVASQSFFKSAIFCDSIFLNLFIVDFRDGLSTAKLPC